MRTTFSFVSEVTRDSAPKTASYYFFGSKVGNCFTLQLCFVSYRALNNTRLVTSSINLARVDSSIRIVTLGFMKVPEKLSEFCQLLQDP